MIIIIERRELISQLIEKGKELDSENYVYIKLNISEPYEERVYNIQSVSKRKYEISFKIGREIETTISIQNLLIKLESCSEDNNLVYKIDKLHFPGTHSFEITGFEIIDGNIYLKSILYPEPVL